MGPEPVRNYALWKSGWLDVGLDILLHQIGLTYLCGFGFDKKIRIEMNENAS